MNEQYESDQDCYDAQAEETDEEIDAMEQRAMDRWQDEQGEE